jgi:NitT/TauT family transport system substrate-binding protein
VSNISRARVLAGGAALALAPTIVRAQTLEKLRMSAVPTDDMTPIYWAVKSGMYRKVGIDLEIVPVSSGSASTAAVVGGAYEMGKASPVASLLAHLRGLPVTIIANGSRFLTSDKWNGMVIGVDSSIKTAAECNGKTGAAAGLNDINQLAMMSFIDKNGGDSKTVKWLEVPGSAVAAAIAEKRIDFAVLNEPQLSAALGTGKVKILTTAFASVSGRWLTSAYLAQPAFADKNPDLMRRFAKATYDSASYTNAHEAETIEVMSEASKIPVATFKQMARIGAATSGDPTFLQPVIDTAAKYGVIPRAFPPKDMYWGA